MIKTKPLYINLLLTILALGLHGYLANKYFLLQNAEATGSSFCNLGGVWNCDAVNTSTFSKMFGQPIALWGLATHIVFLFCQIMVALKQDVDDNWARLTVYFSVLIAATSLVMGFISLTQIGSLCLFCMSAYILSFLNLVFLKLAGFNFWGSFKSIGSAIVDKTSWMTVVAVPLLVFIIGVNWAGPNQKQNEYLAQDRIAAWSAAPVSKFDLNLGLRLGASPEEAKMTIVEFADFRCPHCKHAAPSIKAFVQSRKDVALLFKAYPLDGTCNNDPGFNGHGDGISCRMAFAVVCAEKLEQKGWKLYDILFEQQEEFRSLPGADEVDKKLCSSGIQDCEKFKTCMSDEATKIMVQQMAQEGTQAGLQGTPTFYVNNKLLNGAQLLPVIEKAYSIIKGQ